MDFKKCSHLITFKRKKKDKWSRKMPLCWHVSVIRLQCIKKACKGRKVASSNVFFKVEEFELNTQKKKKCKFAEAWCSGVLSAKIPQLEGSRKSHRQSLKGDSITPK